MSARAMVDRNGLRFGAGLSAVVLLVGFVFQVGAVVPFVAAALGIGAVFGLRFSPLGYVYRVTKKTFRLPIPVELEDAAPPRFAQLLGFAFLTLAIVFPWWVPALIVAGLQLLLAVTGICVGCEMYLLGKRLAAKGT
jgi:hypothetical protein